jgi:hypothetical protein
VVEPRERTPQTNRWRMQEAPRQGFARCDAPVWTVTGRDIAFYSTFRPRRGLQVPGLQRVARVGRSSTADAGSMTDRGWCCGMGHCVLCRWYRGLWRWWVTLPVTPAGSGEPLLWILLAMALCICCVAFDALCCCSVVRNTILSQAISFKGFIAMRQCDRWLNILDVSLW